MKVLNRCVYCTLILMTMIFIQSCDKVVQSNEGFITPEIKAVIEQISSLPKEGADERFGSMEAMQQCDNDLVRIAQQLSLLFDGETASRAILQDMLKKRDTFGEIAFNEFLVAILGEGPTIYHALKNNGLSDLDNLLVKHPDLRLSLPVQFDDRFNAFDEFIIAASPVTDERFIDHYIGFKLGGEEVTLDFYNYTGMQAILLEIDENVDNHQKNESIVDTDSLGRVLLTVDLRTYYQYMENKLEGTLNRAEFNVTVTLGTVVYVGGTDFDFPSTADRGFGITEVNKADKDYWYDRFVFDITNLGAGEALGICVWEDDPGGEDKLTYNAADIGTSPDYEDGYLSAHGSCPDDLFGYNWITVDDIIATDNHTRAFRGYNSSYGGNTAYPEHAKLNAYMWFYESSY